MNATHATGDESTGTTDAPHTRQSVLASAATTGLRVDNIVEFDHWMEMARITQDSIERAAGEEVA